MELIMQFFAKKVISHKSPETFSEKKLILLTYISKN